MIGEGEGEEGEEGEEVEGDKFEERPAAHLGIA